MFILNIESLSDWQMSFEKQAALASPARGQYEEKFLGKEGTGYEEIADVSTISSGTPGRL